MTKHWWADLVPDGVLPSDAEIEAQTAALRIEAAGWLAEFDAKRAAPQTMLTSREAIDEWLREERSDHQQAVHTGWPVLDNHLGRPIRAGELVLIAARAGVGKTWTMQSWVESTLIADPAGACVIFELEMLAWHLAERLASHALGVDPSTARKRAREGLAVEDVIAAAPMLDRLVISEAFVSVDQLPEAIEKATERLGRRPTVVAVDYLGLLRWDGPTSARSYERASENAKKLKAVARDQRVAILAAAQLSRDAGDGSSKPTLDSLRDSGVVEEAADRVVAFWQPAPIEDGDAQASLVDVEVTGVVLKNRFGPKNGHIHLAYDHALRLVEPRPPVAFPYREQTPDD